MSRRHPSHVLATSVAAWVLLGPATVPRAATPFDHDYSAYARLLASHVEGARVNYTTLQADRVALDAVVASFNAVAAHQLLSWTPAEQLAFWINAYNAFTLRAVVDRYPIGRRRFSLHPDNSIRQISGFWDRQTWSVAGRRATLDEIEHGRIRSGFAEPLIHFAIHSASVSGPPLAAEPYRAATLEQQLELAARRFLDSPHGLILEGHLLRVSRVFKWYGADFVERFAPIAPPYGARRDQAILGVVIEYGPSHAAGLAAHGPVHVSFLPYDWSLNDANQGP